MSPMTVRVTTQLALGVSIALLLAGCGNGPTSVPIALTAAPGVVGGPTFPVGPYVVSGAVTDAVGPIAGANVNAWVITTGISYSYMYVHGPLRTDGAGHYRMTDLPSGANLRFQVYKDGYVQQCAAPSVTIEGDLTMDLALVAKSNVTASATQAAPLGLRWISGTIVEITPAGKAPVAGAFVDFEPLEDLNLANTYSDATGRFALCGLPQNDSVTVSAGLRGRVVYVTVPPGQTTGIEITLP
jgi:carboxypeptidase family protein